MVQSTIYPRKWHLSSPTLWHNPIMVVGWTSRITNRLGNDVKDQIIYTETFESGQANRISFENYANFVVNNLNREAGGIGAYHINADSFDKNEYRYVRNAISIMNPPIK